MFNILKHPKPLKDEFESVRRESSIEKRKLQEKIKEQEARIKKLENK